MAKFRSSHSRKKHTVFSGALRIVLIVAVLGTLFFLTDPLIDNLFSLEQATSVSDNDQFYLPAPEPHYPIVRHKYFTLAYDEGNEQARWVAYHLNASQLKVPKVPRTDFFTADSLISTGSAHYEDYRRSGYSRGHLVPAADRAFDAEAMEETFLMSNISPQKAHFNGGIWRELEENVRDWAKEGGALYIVTGPIFESKSKMIGKNSVKVPTHFYKVVLDAKNAKMDGIGYIIPNHVSTLPLAAYARSIDDVEEETGLNFYHEFMTDDVENLVESTLEPGKWPIDNARFQRRLKTWNNQ